MEYYGNSYNRIPIYGNSNYDTIHESPSLHFCFSFVLEQFTLTHIIRWTDWTAILSKQKVSIEIDVPLYLYRFHSPWNARFTNAIKYLKKKLRSIQHRTEYYCECVQCKVYIHQNKEISMWERSIILINEELIHFFQKRF